MRELSEKEYIRELKKIRLKNESKKRKQKLKEEKNKYRTKHKLPSTSKLIAIYLFIILNVVLIYSMVSMWKFMDLSYLGVLITDVAAQVLTYVIYSAKALRENTSTRGFVYEARMQELNKQEVSNDGEEPVG